METSKWRQMPKTLAEIDALGCEVLTCQQIAPVLCADPHTLHLQAIERPEMLGFPVIVVGSRVKIPKKAFLSYMGFDK